MSGFPGKERHVAPEGAWVLQKRRKWSKWIIDSASAIGSKYWDCTSGMETHPGWVSVEFAEGFPVV